MFDFNKELQKLLDNNSYINVEEKLKLEKESFVDAELYLFRLLFIDLFGKTSVKTIDKLIKGMKDLPNNENYKENKLIDQYLKKLSIIRRNINYLELLNPRSVDK